MKKKILFVLLTGALFVCEMQSDAVAQANKEEPKKITVKVFEPGESPIVKTFGRLKTEKHGQDEWLILHSVNGQGYIVKGKLTEDLKRILADLGEENLVWVAGRKDGASSVSCHTSFAFDEKGERKAGASCIRYYHLEVAKIGETKKSPEKLPPLKRDAEAEKKALATASSSSGLQAQSIVQYVTLESAVIQSLNMRTPIKTMEVRFQDKDGKTETKTLFIGQGARVAKKKAKMDDTKEPFVDVSLNSLKVGQEVSVVYARDELKNEAVIITITKDID